MTRSDGMPLSWKHFVYGMGALSRHEARERLKLAGSVRIAMAQESQERDAWHRIQSQHAGYS